MKISPMIKTVTCITYSALILLSIIILWCVFSSTVESFGDSSDKCYKEYDTKSGSTCPSPATPETPECNEDSPDSPDSPDDDTPDEILCQNAPDPVAQTSEWTTHQGKGCDYLTKKGEKKCNERHVVYDNGDKVWCKWDNDECIDGGSCGAADDGAGTVEAGTVAASPAPYTCDDTWLPVEGGDDTSVAEGGVKIWHAFINNTTDAKNYITGKFQSIAIIGSGQIRDRIVEFVNEKFKEQAKMAQNYYVALRNNDNKSHSEAWCETADNITDIKFKPSECWQCTIPDKIRGVSVPDELSFDILNLDFSWA